MTKNALWYPYTQMADPDAEATRLFVTHGEGVYVHTQDGRRLLDGYSQMWCNALGHAHPRLNAALAAQAAKISHSSLFSATNLTSLELSEMVAELCREEFGEDSPQHVFFSDNGSTAIEVGLKMALQYHRNLGQPERRKLLCFADAYHGDTAATMTLGGVELFRQAYEPITFEVLRASYPIEANRFDPPSSQEAADYAAACRELRQIFSAQGAAMAAVVIEPGAQGAGGMRPCHRGFLPLLRELCDEFGVLLIADEVMTAFGRIGATFACAAEGVTPDILCLAKALTNGYLPLALTVARAKVYDAFLGEYGEFKHLFHGHTFAGNQLGGAVAIETLKIMRESGLVAKIQRQQGLIEERLKQLGARAESDASVSERNAKVSQAPLQIGRVRQRGFVIGIPLTQAGAREANVGYTGLLGKQVCARALERGAIIRPLGDIVVLMPILCSSDQDLHDLFDIVDAALVG